jgi:hypothetical protein
LKLNNKLVGSSESIRLLFEALSKFSRRSQRARRDDVNSATVGFRRKFLVIPTKREGYRCRINAFISQGGNYNGNGSKKQHERN